MSLRTVYDTLHFLECRNAKMRHLINAAEREGIPLSQLVATKKGAAVFLKLLWSGGRRNSTIVQ